MTAPLFISTKGSPKDPAVLCVHGLLGSSRNLLRLTQEVANSGFYVVSYDQPGHGHSPHLDTTNDYTLPNMAKALIQVLDSQGIDQAHLVGHSMGGRVSLTTTALHPERVKSLTMLDVGIRLSQEAWKELNDIIAPLPASFASKQEAQTAITQHSVQMQQFLLSNLRTVGDRLQWIFDLNGARTILDRALQIDQLENWKNVKCPVLVARGENSPHFRQEELDFMLANNPHAQSATIPNAGHWVHVDNLVDTSKIIVRFLKGH